MKDKERQTEELAKEMSKELCGFYDKRKRKCTNCFGMEEDCDLHCNFGRTLEKLSEAGYRKVDKDSIVLTPNQKICMERDWYYLGVEYGRNEAADKIIHDLMNIEAEDESWMENQMFVNYINKIVDKLEELAKQFSVEIKE